MLIKAPLFNLYPDMAISNNIYSMRKKIITWHGFCMNVVHVRYESSINIKKMLKNIENIDESFTFCFLDYQISGLKLDINAQKALDRLHA